MNIIDKIFKIKENNTTIKTEISAGLTTFFTMSYLFILSPKILESAGLSLTSSITVTVIMVFIGSILMAFIANKPFALAPFLGETAFISYTLCLSLGFSIKLSFTAVLISGIILLVLTLLNIRMYIIEQIPQNIKTAFCTGLGLFFIFIALQYMQIVKFTNKSIPIEAGNFVSLPVILGILSFILLITLIKRGVKFAIIISILATTIIGILLGDVQIPHNIFSLPSGIEQSFFQLDFRNILNKDFIPLIFIIFLLANIDTAGGIIGLEYKTSDTSNTTRKKTMIADSIAVIIAPILGTTTTGVYLDSITGINAGGKTGLTSITVGIMFLIGLIFTPLIMIIPTYAYAPALLYVGIIMTSLISKIDFSDISEYSSALISIAIMIFTYNIGIGVISAFIIYPLIKLLCGQKEKINLTTIVMMILSVLFLIIYPY